MSRYYWADKKKKEEKKEEEPIAPVIILAADNPGGDSGSSVEVQDNMIMFYGEVNEESKSQSNYTSVLMEDLFLQHSPQSIRFLLSEPLFILTLTVLPLPLLHLFQW